MVTGLGGNQESRTPARQRKHRGLESTPVIRQFVDRRGGGRLEFAASDNTLPFEASQSICQHAAAQSGKSASEIAEALRSSEEFAQDQHHPAVTENLGGSRQRTELLISKRIHAEESTTDLVLNSNSLILF
jgi:hypothetical protein